MLLPRCEVMSVAYIPSRADEGEYRCQCVTIAVTLVNGYPGRVNSRAVVCPGRAPKSAVLIDGKETPTSQSVTDTVTSVIKGS
jgi:hypothetical protein